jgi:hypothetical protein
LLSQLAAKYAVSNEELALAWLMNFGDGIVPIPGASRIDTALSLSRALEPPTLDEEFESVEVRPFVRETVRAEARALILDFDDLVGHDRPALHQDNVAIEQSRRDALARHRAAPWRSARTVGRGRCFSRGSNDGRAHRRAFPAIRIFFRVIAAAAPRLLIGSLTT